MGALGAFGDIANSVAAIGGLVMSVLSYEQSQREYKVSQITGKYGNELSEDQQKEAMLNEQIASNDMTATQYGEAASVIQDELQKDQQAMQQVYNKWNYDKSMQSNFRADEQGDNTYDSFIQSLRRYSNISKNLLQNARTINKGTNTYQSGMNSVIGIAHKVEDLYNQDKSIIGNSKSKAGTGTIYGILKNNSNILTQELNAEEKVGNKPTVSQEMGQGFVSSMAHGR